MARTVAVINFKGGVGKTTLTVNLGAALAAQKKGARPISVLIVDVDPQAHATLYLMGKLPPPNESLAGVIQRFQKSQQEFIRKEDIFGGLHPNPVFDGRYPTLHLLPAHHDLRTIETDIERRMSSGSARSPAPRHYKILRYLLEQVVENYDYVLFDCAPNHHWLSASAIFAADDFIIPFIADFLSASGMHELLLTLAEDARSKAADRPKSVRMLPAMMWRDARDTVHSRYIEEIRNVRIAEWRQASPTLAELLNKVEVVEGLQYQQIVKRQIQAFRPLIELNAAEAARLQLESLAARILKWK